MSSLIVPIDSFAIAPVVVELAYHDGDPAVRLTIGADTSGGSDGAPPRHIDVDYREAQAIASALAHYADEAATECAVRHVS